MYLQLISVVIINKIKNLDKYNLVNIVKKCLI